MGERTKSPFPRGGTCREQTGHYLLLINCTQNPVSFTRPVPSLLGPLGPRETESLNIREHDPEGGGKSVGDSLSRVGFPSEFPRVSRRDNPRAVKSASGRNNIDSL